tara:strand:+ start:1619 stop:3652 length:2034 start_codon:yes stop_codon:yes gene_type:complete
MGKYDLGIQTEYKSKFVDPGLDTFKEAAINYRSRFEKNQSVTNSLLASVAEEQFMPGEIDATQQEMMENINSQLGASIESGAYHTMDMDLNRAVQYYTSDPELSLKRSNYKEYLKTQTIYDTYGEQNVYDPQQGSVENFQSVADDGEGGIQKNRYTNKAQKLEDYNATVQAIVGNMRENQAFVNRYGQEAVDGLASYLGGNKEGLGYAEGVSMERMNNMLNDLLGAFKMTPAGAQLQDRYMNSNQNDFGKPLETEQATDKALVDYMRSVTKNQVGLNIVAPPEGITNQSSTTTDGSIIDQVASIYRDKKGEINLTPDDYIATKGVERLKGPGKENMLKFDVNSREYGGQGITIDFASLDITDTQLNDILRDTPFESYGDGLEPAERKAKRITLLQTLNTYGYSADEDKVEYVISHLGLGDKDTPAMRGALKDVSNELTERMGIVELENMGGALDKNFTGVLFTPSGKAKVVGHNAYPVGTMYIPSNQLVSDFDIPGVSYKNMLDIVPDYEEAKVGNRRVFNDGVVTIDGVEYLTIPGAFGKPVDLSDNAVGERLQATALGTTAADISDSQPQRLQDRGLAVYGEFAGKKAAAPALEMLKALYPGTQGALLNEIEKAITIGIQNGSVPLTITEARNLAKDINNQAKLKFNESGSSLTFEQAQLEAFNLYRMSGAFGIQ